MTEAKRGRGRPKGSVDTKPRKPYTPSVALLATCANECCKVEFSPNVSSARFCSDRCRNRVNNQAGQARRRNSAERPCRYCGQAYTPEYGSLRTYYCTTECRDKGHRLLVSGSTHRRRARKYGCEYQTVNKLTVFERDGWLCYLCGQDTPRKARGTQAANAPELDHVVPLAKGGAHSYENTRCCCRGCNQDKADS